MNTAHQLVYPKQFAIAIRNVFSDASMQDRPLLNALKSNQFSLGNLLFQCEQKIEIDPAYITEHLRQTADMMLHPTSYTTAALSTHITETINLADMIEKKSSIQDLYEQWKAWYDTSQETSASTIPLGNSFISKKQTG